MFLDEVSKRFTSAKMANRRYLLVCFDTLDRARGDKDLGYYYQELDDAEAVHSRLSELQLTEWTPSDMRDSCVAVIDLLSSTQFSEDICDSPTVWIARNKNQQ